MNEIPLISILRRLHLAILEDPAHELVEAYYLLKGNPTPMILNQVRFLLELYLTEKKNPLVRSVVLDLIAVAKEEAILS